MNGPTWKNALKWIQTLCRAVTVLVGIAGLAFIILFVYWEGSLTWKGISTTFTFVLGNVAALIAIVLTGWEASPMIAHYVINKWKKEEQAKGQAEEQAAERAAMQQALQQNEDMTLKEYLESKNGSKPKE